MNTLTHLSFLFSFLFFFLFFCFFVFVFNFCFFILFLFIYFVSSFFLSCAADKHPEFKTSSPSKHGETTKPDAVNSKHENANAGNDREKKDDQHKSSNDNTNKNNNHNNNHNNKPDSDNNKLPEGARSTPPPLERKPGLHTRYRSLFIGYMEDGERGMYGRWMEG